jgi:hypothetical protein
MMIRHADNSGRPFRSREDEWDYRLIYAMSFAMFFTAAAGARVTDWSWMSDDAAKKPRKSVVAQAKSDASTAVAFAFMS